jgi:hypothetical protein
MTFAPILAGIAGNLGVKVRLLRSNFGNVNRTYLILTIHISNWETEILCVCEPGSTKLTMDRRADQLEDCILFPPQYENICSAKFHFFGLSCSAL